MLNVTNSKFFYCLPVKKNNNLRAQMMCLLRQFWLRNSSLANKDSIHNRLKVYFLLKKCQMKRIDLRQKSIEKCLWL